jgi:hypothetical protein
MDKRIAGLLGAAAALTTMHMAAQAAPAPSTDPAPAASYGDLLAPIPDALSALKADDARLASGQAEQQPVELAQYFYHHHHHHHHHRFYRVLPRPYFHHHHHHHHHHGGFGIYIR